MGTKSRIGILNQDGTVRSVYCHFNGQPQFNGAKLVRHYKDRSKVEALINLGHLQILDKHIECPEGHSMDKPIDNFTVAFHRDGGAFEDPFFHKSVKEFINDRLESYGYLFTLENEWLCFDGRTKEQIKLDEYKDSEITVESYIKESKHYVSENNIGDNYCVIVYKVNDRNKIVEAIYKNFDDFKNRFNPDRIHKMYDIEFQLWIFD